MRTVEGKMQTKTEIWPLDDFILDPEEVARHDDPEEIRLRGLDLLERGQINPVSATVSGRMIGGHGRWLAAKSAGIKELKVTVYPELNETDFILTRASENLQRKQLTPYRIYLLCDATIKLTGCDQQTLAAKMHVSPATMSKNLSPSKCIPEWVEALKSGKVGLDACSQASQLPPEDQPALLIAKLGGANREQLARAVRKTKGGDATAVRVGKIKIMLASGITVAISGDGLSLDDAIDAVKDTGKELVKGRDQGLDAKTIMAVMRDKAKAS
jgi:ParB-like chromosome segregation protein Spo0J